MKKIISLSKELNFPTMIGEISSISLDDNLSFVSNNKIEGNFIVSGTYKMTEASRIDEDFNYNIPVEIDLTEQIDIDSGEIIIDNFTYEVVNDEILLCKIDVKIEALELIDDIEEEKEGIIEEEKEEIIEEEKEEIIEEAKEEEIDRACDDNITIEEQDKEESPSIELKSLFSDLNDDTFKSYTVYIVRGNDTIESILEKYSITKEELASYNNLDEITINSKLIIPTSNED